MAQKKGRKPVRLAQSGKYTSPKQNPGKALKKKSSISGSEPARRLLRGPKLQPSRRKLLSSPRPSTRITRKVLSNPRSATTTTRELLSNPRPMNNEELSQILYSSSFPGWVTSTLPTDLQARHLLQEALIPSPLTDIDWDNLQPERKAAWLDIVDYTSNETRALYNYIRENLPDIDGFIFGGEKEFPSKCNNGLLCNLVKDDASADNLLYTDSDDDDDVPITMFRKRWIAGDFVLPLDPQVGSGQMHTATEGRALSSASSCLELRRLKLGNQDRYGFFITNGSLAPLFVNGISIGMNMVAGPLPDFAVIEAEDVVFFWWCTLQGVTYIPKYLPTNEWGPGSASGRSKRTLKAVEGYENLNDEAPAVKRPKFDEVAHAGTPSSTGRSTRGNGERAKDVQATKETANRNETAVIGGHTGPMPDKDQPRKETENDLPLPSSWNDDYRRRMTACNAKANRADGKDGTPRAGAPMSIESLFMDDVFLPIAAVWYGLVNQDIRFAFGTKRLFELARYDQDHGISCVLSPNILIMPLMFSTQLPNLAGDAFERSGSPPTSTIGKNKNANKQNKSSPKADPTSTECSSSSLGEQQRRFDHCVLATAERINSFNNKESVRLTFMDSLKIPENYDQYRQAARNIVRNSQWMKDSLVWNDESWPMVAQQGSSSLTPVISCIHVVLNAWAYMLNISLAHNPRLTKDFYAEARKVTQLALKGCLDSRTIRAFMQAYEYATYEDLVSVRQRQPDIQNAADGLRHMQTVYMNESIFDEAMDEMQRNERDQSTKGSDDSSPSGEGGPSGSGRHPLGEDPLGPEGDPPGLEGDPPGPEANPPAPAGDPTGPKGDQPVPGGDPPESQGDPSAPGGDPPASGGGSSVLPASWKVVLDAGLKRHTEHFYQQSAEFRKTCTRIMKPTNVEDERAHLAIASLWDGLRRADITFGFGTAATFQLNRSKATVAQGTTAVAGPCPLIIPLLMNEAHVPTPPPALTQPAQKIGKAKKSGRETTGSEENTKSRGKGRGKKVQSGSKEFYGVGHFVLAIAERRENNRVQITIMDTRKGYVDKEDLVTVAQGLVINSGWMGVDGQGNPLNNAVPNFMATNYPEVPSQHCGNTCGLYIILNAWAYMLGIPIREARVRDGSHPHYQFHAMALRLINLALAGFMDSSTIQAFLNDWGYAVEQDVNDLNVHVVRADAQRMDQQTLADRIGEQRDLDQALALEPPPTEAQITQVTNMEISREMAIRQLKLAKFDAQTVSAILTAARSSPGPGVPFKPCDEDIAFVIDVTGFSFESVTAELTRTRGDRNTAVNNLFDQYKTGSSPTGARSGSTPHTAPPDTGLEHSYNEVDIGRLMSYRDISLNTVLRQLDRAGGDVGKAEERIRHLSNALSSNSGSSQSHHSAANNSGPSNPEPERPYTDADVDEVMATKQQVQEQVSEGRENFAGNVERSRRDMIQSVTQGGAPSTVTNPRRVPGSHPPGKITTSDSRSSHTKSLTPTISTSPTTTQVNPPVIVPPGSSNSHERVTPSLNIEQPPHLATPPPPLRRQMVFPEEDVNTLTSIGYSRSEAVFALEMGEGDLSNAVDYLYAQFLE